MTAPHSLSNSPLSLEALREIANSFERAFTEVAPQISREERIVELVGAQWLGRWEGQILFRDPVTGSSCSLPEENFSAAGVLAKLASKRKEFGVIS